MFAARLKTPCHFGLQRLFQVANARKYATARTSGASLPPKPPPSSANRSTSRFTANSNSNTKRTNPRFRRLAIASGVLLIGYSIDEYYYLSLLQRSVRALYVLLWVAYQYGQNASSYDSLEELHEIAAEKLFAMLEKNKGLYIKQGQAIANQGQVFPVAFQKRFVKLYDLAPKDSWQLIDRILRRELGSTYEKDVFEYIEHNPVASALIAQVHRARLKNEHQDVAVKVQHPYIQRQIGVDLAIYRLMSWVYSKTFDLPLLFFTKYVSDQLVKEADFRIESANASRLALLLENDPEMATLGIYVPKNFDKYTAPQVLVTEWIDGVSLTDKQRLIDAKLDITRIMNQYVTFFGRQIFEYAFVHSDPHPGNLLARFHHGKQQLVILDHGLYVSLPKKFQDEYRQLWKSIFQFDQSEIENIAHEWGIGSTDLLTSVVQLRPPKDADINKGRSSYELMKSFLGDESRFPLQLLFLSRTMRMIQNLNQAMGSPVNRINILTNSAVQVLWNEPWHQRTIRAWLLLVTVRVALFFSDVVFWFFRLRQIISGDRYGGKGEGMEDFIEKYMMEAAKGMGFEVVEGM